MLSVEGPTLGVFLQRCPSYRESNTGTKERQGPTLSVRFAEVSVLQMCPLRESVLPCCSLSLTSLNETPCLKPGGTDRRSDNNKKI